MTSCNTATKTSGVCYFTILFWMSSIGMIFEPLIRRAHRSWMHAHTNYSKELIESLQFYVSDFWIPCFCLILFLKYKSYSKSHIAKESLYLVFFIFCLVLSLIFSKYLVMLFQLSQLLLWMGPVGLYFLSRRLVEKTDVKIFINVIFSIASFQAVLAILQYLNQDVLGLRFLGEPKHVSAYFWMDPLSLTFFDYLTSQGPAGSIFRAFGTFSHPNVLGGFLVMSLLLGLSLYTRLSHSRERIAYFLLIFVQVIALFLTFSRAALFTFLFLGAFWLFLQWRRSMMPLVLVLSFAFLFCFVAFLPQIKSRGGIINYNQTSKASDLPRLESMQSAMNIILDNAYFGVGPGNYGRVKKAHEIYVHNSFMLIAAETGLAGLFAFVLFITRLLSLGWRDRHDAYLLSVFCVICMFCILSFLDVYPLIFHKSRSLFFLAAGFMRK